MTGQLAIKELSASDCTFFENVFRKIGAGNQKSINLNADVLTGKLYPILGQVASASPSGIPMHLAIYGPGGKGAHKIARKIIKNNTYKNYRLNGEFVAGPPDDPHRYDNVAPGDLAIMSFHGEPIPNSIDLVIVSQADPQDTVLVAALKPMLTKSMISLRSDELASVAKGCGIADTHPVFVTAGLPEQEAALEDASQGGIEGLTKLLKNKSGKKVSSAELVKARAKAERIGREGEGLVNGFLADLIVSGEIQGFSWSSDENCVCPYDFEIKSAGGARVLVDVKSTDGPFGNVIHISLAEVIEAANSEDYRIYRISGLTEEGGFLSVSENISGFAKELKQIHETNFREGIRVDSFSISPAILKWKYKEKPVEWKDEMGS